MHLKPHLTSVVVIVVVVVVVVVQWCDMVVVMRNEPFETQMTKNLHLIFSIIHFFLCKLDCKLPVRGLTGNWLESVFVSPLFTLKY
jgi:hypothetical protein